MFLHVDPHELGSIKQIVSFNQQIPCSIRTQGKWLTLAHMPPALKSACPSTKLTWFSLQASPYFRLRNKFKTVKATSVPDQYQNNQVICADLDSALPPCLKHTMYPVTLKPKSSLSFPPFCSILNSTFNTWLSYNFLFLINSGTHTSHCHRHFMFLPLKWLCDLLQQPLDAYYGNNYVSYSCIRVLTIST